MEYAALGPTKRCWRRNSCGDLRARFGASGFVHFGQGKWYPGEQLPRWALGCYWRADGEAAWHDTTLFADETKTYGYGSPRPSVSSRTRQAARRQDEHVQAGYEDTWYYLLARAPSARQRQPVRRPADDELERDRLRASSSQGLGDASATHCRSAAAGPGVRWTTARGSCASERLYLMPGDSPMGFGCRSIRCRGPLLPTSWPSMRLTHSRRGRRSALRR